MMLRHLHSFPWPRWDTFSQFLLKDLETIAMCLNEVFCIIGVMNCVVSVWKTGHSRPLLILILPVHFSLDGTSCSSKHRLLIFYGVAMAHEAICTRPPAFWHLAHQWGWNASVESFDLFLEARSWTVPGISLHENTFWAPRRGTLLHFRRPEAERGWVCLSDDESPVEWCQAFWHECLMALSRSRALRSLQSIQFTKHNENKTVLEVRSFTP